MASQTDNSSTINASNVASGVIPQSTHASLYVGDLSADVNEAQIYEKFGQIGQILSIRVCRDMVTRKSLCYAYVNFQSHGDAEKAFEGLNFDLLMDRPMRIMWSQRDPAIRKSGVGNVFIKNLDKKITSRELFDTLSCFGKILSLKIAMDERGHSKGYGFVHFATEESATKAISTMNGMKIEDKQVVFCKFVPRKDRPNAAGERKFNNVYIKNFGEDMTDDKLFDLFKEYGDIISAKVMMTQGDDPKPKGFGFCSFKSPEDAAKAVSALNGQTVGGRTLFVGRAQKKSERVEVLRRQFESRPEKKQQYVAGINLYVKNLDDKVDDDQLYREFAKFGSITSCKVMTDQFGNSKGFGFVCYSNPEEAASAVTEMSYKMINEKPVYVALAQKKEERRTHLSNAQRTGGMGRVHMGMIPNAGMMGPYAGGAGGPAGNAGAPGQFFPQNPMAAQMGQAPNQFPMFGNNFNNPSAAAAMMHGNAGGGMPANVGQRNIITQNYANLATQNNARMQLILQQQQQQAMVAARQHPQRAPNSNVQMGPRDGMAAQQFNIAQHQQQRMTMPTMNAQTPFQQQRFPMNRGSMPMQQQQNRMVSQQVLQQQQQAQQQAAAVQQTQQPQSSDSVDPLRTNSEDFVRQLAELKTDQEKKQVIGEKLFHMLQDHVGSELVGKVTGMLLGSDERDLIDMIIHSDTTTLYERADQAKRIVLDHREKARASGAAANPGGASGGNAPGPSGDN